MTKRVDFGSVCKLVPRDSTVDACRTQEIVAAAVNGVLKEVRWKTLRVVIANLVTKIYHMNTRLRIMS